MTPEERASLTDRDLLIRIDTRQDELIETSKDHEARLRKLEERRTVSPAQLWSGLAAAVGTMAAGAPLIDRIMK